MPSMGKVLHLHYFQWFSQQLFFFCLFVLVWTSSTSSNRWVREDILVLFLILGEKHSVFKYDLSSGIFADAFYQMRKFPSVPSLLNVFIVNRWCVLSSAFLCLLRWSCGFVLYTFRVAMHWLLHVEPTSHSWGEPRFVTAHDPFHVLSDPVCRHCWGAQHLYSFIRLVRFSRGLSVWSWYQGKTDLIKLNSVPLPYFGSLWGSNATSSLNT